MPVFLIITIVLQESKIAVLKNMSFYDKILLYWGHCLPAVNVPAQHFSQPEKISAFQEALKWKSKPQRNDGKMTAAVSGRIDIITAPELEQWFYKEVEGLKRLVLDLSEVEYLSSAGLRVILGAYKVMEKRDGLLIGSPSPEVMEVLVLTGLANVFDIK